MDLLLSTTTNSYLRSVAAHALVDLDAETAADTLCAVLDEVRAHPDHDPDDELRGLALEMNWPSTLSAEQLLKSLIHPQNTTLIGNYAMFLEHFLDQVDDQGITDILRAVAPQDDTSSGTDVWVDEDDPGPTAADRPSGADALALLTGTRRGQRVMIALLRRALESLSLIHISEPTRPY